LADNGERSSPADGKGADWRSKKAKHGINKLQSSRSNKEENRKTATGEQRRQEKRKRERERRAYLGKTKAIPGSWIIRGTTTIFEPTVCESSTYRSHGWIILRHFD